MQSGFWKEEDTPIILAAKAECMKHEKLIAYMEWKFKFGTHFASVADQRVYLLGEAHQMLVQRQPSTKIVW